MSDTKPKSKAKTKSSKADSSGATKSTADKSSADFASTSTSETSKSETSKSSSGKPTEKSARESVGGSKEVHYGYFSNVKTPEYLDGWDAIWGNTDGKSKKKSATKKPAKPAARRPLTPVRLNLDLDDLPVEIREGLVKVARAKLKKSRVNYDKRDAAGAVDWQIECWVKRA